MPLGRVKEYDSGSYHTPKRGQEIMGKRNPGALKEYKVNVSVIGSASRTVLAASKEEAERTVEKMLLQPDGQTPQSKTLCAFDWGIPHFYTYGGSDGYSSSDCIAIEE